MDRLYNVQSPYYVFFEILSIELTRNIEDHELPCDSVAVKFGKDTILVNRTEEENAEAKTEEEETKEAASSSRRVSIPNSARILDEFAPIAPLVKTKAKPFGTRKFKIVTNFSNMVSRLLAPLEYKVIRAGEIIATAEQLVTMNFLDNFRPVDYEPYELTMSSNLVKDGNVDVGRITVSLAIIKGERIIDKKTTPTTISRYN